MYTVDDNATEIQDLKVDMQWWISKGMPVAVGLFCSLIGLFCLYNRSLLTLMH